MHRVDLSILNQRVGFESAAAEGVTIVECLFGPYLVTDSGGEPAVRVETGSDEWVIRWAGAEPVSGGGLAVQLEHVLTRAILDALPQVLHVHAAGVVGRAGAVLALGGSGSGKSSIAAAWTVDGRRVLGDDVLFLDRAGVVHPFNKPLKVDAKRARALGISLAETVLWEGGADEAWVDPAGYGGWAPPAAPAALVFLDRREGDGPGSDALALSPLDGPETAQALLQQLMETGGDRAEWFDQLLSLAGDVAAYRLPFSDSRRAASVLARLADEPR